jgi:hypothetical protein
LYLYCFTPADSCDGLELAGLSSNPVSCRTVAGLTVWAEIASAAPRVSPEAIRGHDRVVRAVWAQATACLPVRFGQWVADARTLEARLEERRAELERGLTRVAGAGEHGVRISETRAESGGQPLVERPNTGRAYLEWLQARDRSEEERARRGRALAGVLAASLEGLIRAERVDPLPADQGLVSVSHLVKRAREAEYGVGVERFRASRPDLSVLRTGPWPPYSFGP